MFNLKFTNNEPSKLDEVIDDLLVKLESLHTDTEEYTAVVDQLTKLYALKQAETPKRVSMDTLAIVAGNLLGILLILNHERASIMTSKAVGFVLKPR